MQMQRSASLHTPSVAPKLAGSRHKQGGASRRQPCFRVRAAQRSEEAINSQHVHATAASAEVLERSDGDARTSSSVQLIAEVGQASAPQPQTLLSSPAGAALGIAAAGLIGLGLKAAFDRGSRKYEGDGNVGQEYDAWTNEGLLEYYWGEHIHLGYYNDAERASGYKKKDFKAAKFDFIDEMLQWSGTQAPARILDVGCGFGGTSRHLAKKFPGAAVEGITLSKEQVRRGTELAAEQGVPNAHFQVMDALAMTWPDNSFDLVWACESGEHMPDKKRYVEEMARVLKPGGTMVIATWCQREETAATPFSQHEQAELQFLYDEWAHPYFVSIEEYERLMNGTGQLESVGTADWTDPTIPSWRHSIWVGVYDPWRVILTFNPRIWYKTTREIVTLERMHQAFDSGLMRYGMMKAVKSAQ